MHVSGPGKESRMPRPSPLDLDDDLGCSFCGAPTEFEDRECAACHHALWIRGRTVSVPRHDYHLLLVAEGILIPGALIYTALLLVYLAVYLKAGPLSQWIPAAFGLGSTTDPIGAFITSVVPSALLWLSILTPVLTVLILVMVLSRWFPLYIAAVGLGSFRLFAGLMTVFYSITGQVAPPSPDAAWARPFISQLDALLRLGILLASLVITGASAYLLISLFNVQDHFTGGERRRLLGVDPDVAGSSLSLWLRGREYAKDKMWAQAALHLRQSVSLQPDLAAYKLLAVAYSHLNAYERAMSALDRAEALDRNARAEPETGSSLAQLRALIAQQRQAAEAGSQGVPSSAITGTSPADKSVPSHPGDTGFPAPSAADETLLSLPHLEAAIEPDKQQARGEILALIEADETNVGAWLSLSRVVDTDEERTICLENVLTLEPEHAEALEQLAALQQRSAFVEASTWGPAAKPAHWTTAATPAGDILGEAYRKKHTIASPDPDTNPEGDSTPDTV